MKPQEIAPQAFDAVVPLDAGPMVLPQVYGARAAKLARLSSLGLPVPAGVVLSFDCVREIAAGGELPDLPLDLAPGRLWALRSSPEERAWGGAQALLNIGVSDATLPELEARLGRRAALRLYCRFLQSFGVAVAGLDPEEMEALVHARGVGDADMLDEAGLAGLLEDKKRLFAEETGAEFPAEPMAQLQAAVRAMARSWEAPSARILRQAKGAPEAAGLGLIVQALGIGVGPGLSGAGEVQMVDPRTGAPGLAGRFVPQGQGPDARHGGPQAHKLSRAAREARARRRRRWRRCAPGRWRCWRTAPSGRRWGWARPSCWNSRWRTARPG
jgi:pyruvate, orthophosphate dikinase